MSMFKKLFGDFFGLIRVLGPFLALKWAMMVLLNSGYRQGPQSAIGGPEPWGKGHFTFDLARMFVSGSVVRALSVAFGRCMFEIPICVMAC